MAYVVGYDPTVPSKVGKNVDHLVNYYIPKKDKIKPTKRLSNFKGKIQNIDISKMSGVTHMNVEKNRKFQNKAISKIISITKKKRSSKKRVSSRLRRRG